MKKQLLALTIVAALALGLTGCATPGNLNPNAQAAITAAAALGTAYDLQQRPTDLPYFVAAEQELYTIARSTNVITAASVEKALETSGQNDKFVNLAIVTGLNLANSYITSNTDTNGTAVKQACGWLADGIAQSANVMVSKLAKK